MHLFAFSDPHSLFAYDISHTSGVNQQKVGGGGIHFNPINGPNGPVSMDISLGDDFSIQNGSHVDSLSGQGGSGTFTVNWSGSVAHAPNPGSPR